MSTLRLSSDSEPTCETGFGIALFLQGENRHRQFGEVFERQIIEPAVAREHKGGVEVIAPEAAAVADAHVSHWDF